MLVDSLSFSYRVECTSHRTLAYTDGVNVNVFVQRHVGFKLKIWLTPVMHVGNLLYTYPNYSQAVFYNEYAFGDVCVEVTRFVRLYEQN